MSRTAGRQMPLSPDAPKTIGDKPDAMLVKTRELLSG